MSPRRSYGSTTDFPERSRHGSERLAHVRYCRRCARHVACMEQRRTVEAGHRVAVVLFCPRCEERLDVVAEDDEEG